MDFCGRREFMARGQPGEFLLLAGAAKGAAGISGRIFRRRFIPSKCTAPEGARLAKAAVTLKFPR